MSRIKVLPIFPRFPPSFWGYNYAIEMLGKGATMPPTGLATVAAMLPEGNFDVHRIIDLNVEPLADEQIRESDIVFTSAMIVQRDSLDELIERAHSFNKPVVAGGPYPTSYWKDLEKVDHLVLDEVEVTLQPFLEDLLNGSPQRIYNEHSVRSRSDSVKLSKRGKPLLTRTPIPRWNLLNLKKYSAVAIQYSRGCPFDCDFCDITKLFGKESRTKTPEQMIRELEAIFSEGWRGPVFIVDDNFIGNKHGVRELLPAVERWQKEYDYPFSFFTEASMDLAMPNMEDILHGMVAAGFDQVFLGIESVDQEVLRIMRKGQNLGMSPYDRVRKIQEAGLEVTGGFIIGADGEKPNVFDDLFNFIQEAGVVIPMPGLLTALKDTDLYKRLESEGRLKEESSGMNTHQLSFNFKTEMDERFLIDGYLSLLGRLFDSKNYYARCKKLSACQGKHHETNLVNKNGFLALVRILHQNLIVDPDLEFVKYMVGVAIKNPRDIPKAISNAVKLHHFKTMTEGTLSVHEYVKHTETLYEYFRDKINQVVGDARKRAYRLIEIEQDVVRAAREKYQQLHHDFRYNAQGALEGLIKRVEYDRQNYLQAIC